MMGSFTMRQMIVLALIGFALSVDVCVDYSRSDYCTKYAPRYCRHKMIKTFCRVTCKKCTQPAPVPDCQTLKDDCLAAFNAKRQLHQQTPDLVWDGVAEAQAQAVVDSNDARRRFRRGRYNYYGVALYIYGTNGIMPSSEELCKKAVDRWYKRSENYDYSNPRCGGSFTQLIWKSTTKVGVGISIKRFGSRTRAYIFAHFYRAGNNRRTCSANVMPLKSGVTTRKPPTTPTSTTTTTTTTTSTTTSSGGSLNEFKNACLKKHNEYREKHQGTNQLVYDSTVAKTAQIYAKYLADNDLFEHEKNIPYGENLASYSGPERKDTIEAEDSTKRWYDEIKDYDYNNPGFSMATGHFTQVVWKDSQRLGCGIARKGSKVYVVARYDPPGNYAGKFSENVAPLK